MSIEFDPSHTFGTDDLPDAVAQRTIDLRKRRRGLGLNVQFMKDDGTRDEWSFSTIERRDAFIRGLEREGKTYAISH